MPRRRRINAQPDRDVGLQAHRGELGRADRKAAHRQLGMDDTGGKCPGHGDILSPPDMLHRSTECNHSPAFVHEIKDMVETDP